MLTLALLLSCTSALPTAEEAVQPVATTAPAPPTAPAAVPAQLAVGAPAWVIASTLRLRATPSSEGSVRGSLAINTPVQILELTESWAQVEVSNGTEGWVARDFLAPERLLLSDAIARAQAAAAPEQQLDWWQRAAAIQPSREALEGLAEAYAALGDRRARAVRAQLAWPHTLFPVRDRAAEGALTRRVEVEWSSGYWRERGDVPRSRWGSYGLDPEQGWWVLPATGPAVSARVVGFRSVTGNECADDAVRVVTLELTTALPAGQQALAAHRGEPPASWQNVVEPPALDHDEALARARTVGETKAEGRAVSRVTLAPAGARWLGAVFWETGAFGELGNAIYDGVQLTLSPQDTEVEPLGPGPTPHWLWAERDLTGDGKPERVIDDDCATWVYDADHTMVARTVSRCCGC